MAGWGWLRWLVAGLGAGATGLIIGVPTGIIQTDFYTRMTPVLWWNLPIWVISAILTGLIVATYVQRPVGTVKTVSGRLGLGGLLSAFAVGCPICNKIVVALIGVSGALNLWAPIQPLLGVASVGMLIFALRVRIRGERECRLATREQVSPT